MNDSMRDVTPRMQFLVRLAVGVVLAQTLTACGGSTGTPATTTPTVATAPATLPIPSVAPTITGTSPNTVHAGAAPLTLTISGANFGANSTVSFDGSTVPVTFRGATTLQVAVPAAALTAARTAAVTVNNPAPGAGMSNAMNFTVTGGPNPAPLYLFTDTKCVRRGAESFDLLLYGSNFMAGSILRWNGSERPTTVSSGNRLTARIPASDMAAEGIAQVTVVNPAPGGGGSSPVQINISAGGFRPDSIAVEPSGRFAYVMNVGCTDAASDLSMYAIDPTTGTLASLGLPVVVQRPIGDQVLGSYVVNVDPSGRFVYVLYAGDPDPWDEYFGAPDPGSVSVYAINATDGTLMPVDRFAREWPTSLHFHPSGKFAYLTDHSCCSGAVSTYTVDTHSGTLAAVGTTATPGFISSAVIHPSGNFAYATGYGTSNGAPGSVSTYTIDAATGLLASAGTLATGSNPGPIVMHPSGRFAYVMNYDSNSGQGSLWLYAIDPTGALSSGGTFVAGPQPSAIAIHPTGRFAYITRYDSNTVSMYAIDVATGALSPLGAVATGSARAGIRIHPSGKFAYVTNSLSNDVWTYAIDAATGTLTLIGSIGT